MKTFYGNVLAGLIGFFLLSGGAGAAVRVYPAPAGETFSTAYRVQVNGQSVPVYQARVAPADPQRRWKAMDDKARSAEFYDLGAFAYFDMDGPVEVTVTCPEEIRSLKVQSPALKQAPKPQGKTLRFTLPEARPVVIEVNSNWVGALQLFPSPPDAPPAATNAPGLVYFGPGIHEVTSMVITNNQTVYLAGGAVVRAVIGPEEKFSISGYSGLKNYAPTFTLRGTNISFRGRGILDATACTTHARHPLQVRGTNILIEGVILRDSSTWTIPIRQSARVTVRNTKLLGYRANSDGIDICNSQDVLVEDCFIRTLDDLIVIKSDKGRGPVKNIRARRCVLWNEVAHALSVGAELREDVSDVVFEDCDVIYDKGREWTLRVYHCDSAWIRNVQFRNLRIAESPRLMSLWINKAVWTVDAERGHIDGVTFENIQAQANPLRIEFKGFDADHLVENVRLSKVVVNGKPVTAGDVKTNEFVKGVTVKP
jgi:hypothetical protein